MVRGDATAALGTSATASSPAAAMCTVTRPAVVTQTAETALLPISPEMTSPGRRTAPVMVTETGALAAGDQGRPTR